MVDIRWITRRRNDLWKCHANGTVHYIAHYGDLGGVYHYFTGRNSSTQYQSPLKDDAFDYAETRIRETHFEQH